MGKLRVIPLQGNVEAWVLPTVVSMVELDTQDVAIHEENADRLKNELQLLMLGGDLWMRLWGRFKGISIGHRASQMAIIHLTKAFRDIRCTAQLTVGGYEAEAHLILRRSDESLNLCELFLEVPDEAEKYANCETQEEFRKSFAAAQVRQKLETFDGGELSLLRKSFHNQMSNIGHESWKSLAFFLTVPEANGRYQRLLVNGKPHSESASLSLALSMLQMDRGLRITLSVLDNLATAELKGEVEKFSQSVHQYLQKIHGTS